MQVVKRGIHFFFFFSASLASPYTVHVTFFNYGKQFIMRILFVYGKRKWHEKRADFFSLEIQSTMNIAAYYKNLIWRKKEKSAT